jgi:type I restriction enzyme S subunit
MSIQEDIFPSQWDVFDFTEAFDTVGAGNPNLKKKKYLDEGRYPVVDQGEEEVGGYTDDADLLSDVPLPCIIFGDHTKNFKYIDYPFVIGADGTKVLRPTEKLHPRFAFYYLDGLVRLPDVGYSRHYKYLKRRRVPLPPLDVQRRIVTVLERADALRTKRQQAIGRFDDLLRAAFFDLFGDPVANPKGWETVKFGDLLTTSLWNGLSPSTDGTHPGRVLILSAITDSVFRPEEVKEAMFDRPLSEAQERIVDTDTFLICRGNGNLSMVGTGVFPTEDMPDTLFPDTIIGARPDQDRIHPAYLETLWSTQYVRGQLEKVARTTNGTHKINQKKTRNIELRLPPMEVQRQFASIHDKIQKNKQRYASDRFDALFDALLHRAFRGELSINEAAFEDEDVTAPRENGHPEKSHTAPQAELFN